MKSLYEMLQMQSMHGMFHVSARCPSLRSLKPSSLKLTSYQCGQLQNHARVKCQFRTRGQQKYVFYVLILKLSHAMHKYYYSERTEAPTGVPIKHIWLCFFSKMSLSSTELALNLSIAPHTFSQLSYPSSNRQLLPDSQQRDTHFYPCYNFRVPSKHRFTQSSTLRLSPSL